MQNIYPKGISVIICCYNSEWIIDRCLKALIKQKNTFDISWEIIIVNNNSTDNTVNVVNGILKESFINYSVVDEKMPGLLSARKCGVRHAKYSYIIFCDDDNLLSNNYIESMYFAMETNQQIGAYGGRGIAEFESTPEDIVISYLPSYAIGSQKKNVVNNGLYGAGVCIRKDIITKIYQEHDFLLTGRCGDKLLAGDDSEMIKAIILAGYKIENNDNLTFTHVLSSKRLTFKYLCSIVTGFGLSSPVLYTYDLCINKQSFNKIFQYYIISLLKLTIYFFFKFSPSIQIKYIFLLNQVKGIHLWNISKLKALYQSLTKLQSLNE